MWVCMCRTTTSSRLRSFFDIAMLTIVPGCRGFAHPYNERTGGTAPLSR